MATIKAKGQLRKQKVLAAEANYRKVNEAIKGRTTGKLANEAKALHLVMQGKKFPSMLTWAKKRYADKVMHPSVKVSKQEWIKQRARTYWNIANEHNDIITLIQRQESEKTKASNDK